jgi:hypothetical protein
VIIYNNGHFVNGYITNDRANDDCYFKNEIGVIYSNFKNGFLI